MQRSFVIGTTGDAVHDAKRTFSIGQAVSEKSANINMKKKKKKNIHVELRYLPSSPKSV